MIELRNIAVQKSGKKLFNNFSFQIEENEHWLVRGNNGSGKTTLLQIIANQLAPLAGEVRYGFVEADDWSERYQQVRKAVRLIPAHSLHQLLSGHSDLFYQQRYYASGDEQFPKVRDLLRKNNDLNTFHFPDSFNIDNLLDLELIRLSNGQLKKVVILQQLMKDIPKLLLLDYPFEGLDKESRADLVAFMEDIVHAFGVQLVIVDQHNELPGIINRTITLDHFCIREIVRDYSPGHATGTSISKDKNRPAAESEGPVVVEMKDLTVRYGNITIIDRLNWKVRRGERWALTGRNGSGKTTLFSLINADHPLAYTQQLSLFGRRRGTGESIWDIKRRIMYLGPEQMHFINSPSFGFTAREFIFGSIGASESGKVKEMVSLFQADGFIDLPLRWLSSGQLQMVLLIQCLAQSKELVLLDEPFQFLDHANKERVVNLLGNDLDENTTLIMITHYEEDLVRWAHKMPL